MLKKQLIKDNPGHVTKMAAMPINGKTLQKSSPELVY